MKHLVEVESPGVASKQLSQELNAGAEIVSHVAEAVSGQFEKEPLIATSVKEEWLNFKPDEFMNIGYSLPLCISLTHYYQTCCSY